MDPLPRELRGEDLSGANRWGLLLVQAILAREPVSTVEARRSSLQTHESVEARAAAVEQDAEAARGRLTRLHELGPFGGRTHPHKCRDGLPAELS